MPWTIDALPSFAYQSEGKKKNIRVKRHSPDRRERREDGRLIKQNSSSSPGNESNEEFCN